MSRFFIYVYKIFIDFNLKKSLCWCGWFWGIIFLDNLYLCRVFMQNWNDILTFLNEIGLLPLLLLLMAIPGSILILLIGAKRYLFRGLSGFVTQGFQTWLFEQKARNQIEIKLEERLTDLTEQIKNLVAGGWDTRRFVDTIRDEFKEDHKTIIERLDHIVSIIPKRRSD